MGTVNLTLYTAKRTPGDFNFTDQATAATAGNDYIAPSANGQGDVKIMAQCAGGGNLTVISSFVADGLTLPNKVLALVAGKLYVFSGFDPTYYGLALDIQVSAATNLLVFRG